MPPVTGSPAAAIRARGLPCARGEQGGGGERGGAGEGDAAGALRGHAVGLLRSGTGAVQTLGGGVIVEPTDAATPVQTADDAPFHHPTQSEIARHPASRARCPDGPVRGGRGASRPRTRSGRRPAAAARAPRCVANASNCAGWMADSTLNPSAAPASPHASNSVGDLRGRADDDRGVDGCRDDEVPQVSAGARPCGLRPVRSATISTSSCPAGAEARRRAPA